MVWNGSAPYGSTQHCGGSGNEVMLASTPTTSTVQQPPTRICGAWGNQQVLRAPQHHARVPGRHASIGKTELPLRNTKMQDSKSSAGKEMLAPPRVHCLSRGGPGDHCRYPEDQVPPRTSSRSRQKARHANHTFPRVINLSMNHTAPGPPRVLRLQLPLPSPGQLRPATCPVALAPAPAAQPGAAPGLPRVLRLQLPLPSLGQLRGRHMSYGSSSRCPA
jgi:hypothetical protein